MPVVMKKSIEIEIVTKIESQIEIGTQVEIEIVPAAIELALMLRSLLGLDPDTPILVLIALTTPVGEKPVLDNASPPAPVLAVLRPARN